MAEAGDKGPERKTTTYKQFSTMNSQDGRFGVEQDEFFYLENIMRVGDSKLRSLSGPTATKAVFPPGDETVVVLGDSFGDVLGDSGGDALGSAPGVIP